MHPAKDWYACRTGGAGIVVAEHNACGSEFIHERIAKIGRAIAIQQRFNFDAALGGAQQHAVQLFAHIIFKPDKGLEDHFMLRVVYRIKNGGVIFVPVDQQRDPVAFLPYIS